MTDAPTPSRQDLLAEAVTIERELARLDRMADRFAERWRRWETDVDRWMGDQWPTTGFMDERREAARLALGVDEIRDRIEGIAGRLTGRQPRS